MAVAALFALGSAALAQVPSSHHVVLVIDENTSYSNVMADMPWLVAEGYANGYATKYTSDTGGSLMDYLWLASGSCHSSDNCTLPAGTHDFHCNGKNCYYPYTTTTDPIEDDNIFREMISAGVSWKVYAQSFKLAGGRVSTPDHGNGTSYYRRHNAATWYSDVLNNSHGSGAKIVDLSQLTIDLVNGTLPRFMIIVPDGNHDAHDCPVGMVTCTVAQKLDAADEFLESTLTPILSSTYFQPGGDGLVFVTFDECAGGTNGGCGAAVYTAVIGPKVRPHTVCADPYKHENMLRTILEVLGIHVYPGAAATAEDMSDLFITDVDTPAVTINSPANGAMVLASAVIQATAIPTPGHTISAWSVYVDSVSAYQGGPTSTIDPAVSVEGGKHTVRVRAWDTSGAFGDQTISLTATTGIPIFTISTPGNDANVGGTEP